MNYHDFAVYREGMLKGCYVANTWTEAARMAATQEKDETGESYPWTHYNAVYIPPKARKRFGLEEITVAPEQADALRRNEGDI